MSYEPTNWKTGDVVTSAKLNKLENGVAGNVLVINETKNADRLTLDKTWEEIYNTLNNGGVAIVNIALKGIGDSVCIALAFKATNDVLSGYSIEAVNFSSQGKYIYTCESVNEYPFRSNAS